MILTEFLGNSTTAVTRYSKQLPYRNIPSINKFSAIE